MVLTKFIYDPISIHSQVDVIYLYYLKAFDRVKYRDNVLHSGLVETLLIWFHSYLSKRKSFKFIVFDYNINAHKLIRVRNTVKD